MSANAEIIAELRRVLNERDEAREQLDLTKRELGRWVDRETKAVRERDEARAACPDCAMWAERSARWHDDMQRAERERDEWRDKFLALNQTAGELCNACGWAFKIPGEPCRCEVVKERDEALAKYEVLYEEADRALRAPLLALSAIVGGDAFFAPGPWDSQTQGMNALAERITRSFAIWRDRAAKQSTEDFKRGAEAVRERDEARAEVERLRADADRWKRSCNVFRERDWPKAFQATVTSLEQEVSDAHEQLAKLRKLSKPWEGGAYQRGAEAMREACAQWAQGFCFRAKDVRALPIPEEP